MTIKRTDASVALFLDISFKITPKQFKIFAKIGTHKGKVSYLFNFVFTIKV